MIRITFALLLIGCAQSATPNPLPVDSSVDTTPFDAREDLQLDQQTTLDITKTYPDAFFDLHVDPLRDASVDVTDANVDVFGSDLTNGPDATCFTYADNSNYRGCGHCERVDNLVVFACSPPPHASCYRYAVDCIDHGFLHCYPHNFSQYPGLRSACLALCERIYSQDAGDRCAQFL